jgi:hypothetical protein
MSYIKFSKNSYNQIYSCISGGLPSSNAMSPSSALETETVANCVLFILYVHQIPGVKHLELEADIYTRTTNIKVRRVISLSSL